MNHTVFKVILAAIVAAVLSIVCLTLGQNHQYETPASSFQAVSGSGSGDSTVLISISPPYHGSYADAIQAALSSQLSPFPGHKAVINSLNFVTTKEVHGEYLSQILFKTYIWAYEGVACAHVTDSDVWTVDDICCSDINPEFPFTQTEVSNSNPAYFWVSGVVNDKRITHIVVGFHDGYDAQVMVNPSSFTYAYVREGVNGVKCIQGLDRNNRLVYQYGLL